jgi:hypothetical protein
MARVRALPADSAFVHHLRGKARGADRVLDDPDSIEAFFAGPGSA